MEAQLTGAECEGGLVLSLFEPRPGMFPEPAFDALFCTASPPPACAGALGLAAGGRMRQEIYADEYGIRTRRLELAPTGSNIAAAERLAGVRSLADLEGRTDEPLPIPAEQVRRPFACDRVLSRALSGS